jgi:hypothetical protein
MGIRKWARVWAVATLFGLAACAGRGDSRNASWQEFRVPGAGVAVAVPGAVETQKDVTAKDGTISRSYHVELGTASYAISYATYTPNPKLSLDGWLDTMRKEFPAKMNGKLRGERRFSLGDARGMEFLLDVPRSEGDGPYTMRGRFYVRHVGSGKAMRDVLYQTLIVDNPGHDTDASATRFLDSCHFVEG